MRQGSIRLAAVGVVAFAVATVSVVLRVSTVPAQPAAPAPTVVVPSAATGTTLAPKPAPAVREPGTVRVVSACPAAQTLPQNLVPATPEFDAIVFAQSRLTATINQVQSVVLGQFSYPDASVPRGDGLVTQPCGNVPVPSAMSKSLRWSVPKSLRIHSGGEVTTKVSLKNVSRQTVSYNAGDPITGVITEIGGSRVLARYSGAIAGVGHGATLRPGRSDTVTGLLATASCDVTLGYTLAPGKYSVRFGFQSFNASAGGGTKVDQFVSNPIPLTITTDAAPPFTRSANPPLTPMTLPGAGGGGPGATFLVVSATTRPL